MPVLDEIVPCSALPTTQHSHNPDAYRWYNTLLDHLNIALLLGVGLLLGTLALSLKDGLSVLVELIVSTEVE